MLSDWLLSIEGTSAAPAWALALALMSAFAHAAFGAMQKARYDPWLTRGAVDVATAAIAFPLAVFLVPWPSGNLWLVLAGTVIIHFFYKLFMTITYARGDYTVVYPVVRGTGPLVTVAFAATFFAETYTALQWLGVGLLSGALLMLAVFNLADASSSKARLASALAFAVITGFWVAAYTVYDAWGLRQSPDPFTFLAWFFLLSSLDFPIISFLLWRKDPTAPPLRALVLRGFSAAWLAFFSFGGVMLATRLDKVGEAAVLRETSVIFAALIGWLVLGERIGFRRAIMMCAIAAGAVVVEFGG